MADGVMRFSGCASSIQRRMAWRRSGWVENLLPLDKPASSVSGPNELPSILLLHSYPGALHARQAKSPPEHSFAVWRGFEP